MTNIDRRAVQRQRVFYNADSAVNASAKAARVSQQDLDVTQRRIDLQYFNIK